MRTWLRHGPTRSRLRRLTLPLAGAAVVVLLVAPAQASTSTKFYSVSVTPTTAEPGTAQAFAVTLTNDAGSTQSLGSANVTVPSAFTVTSPANGATVAVTSSGGKAWTVKNASGVLEFRAASTGDALAPAHTVSAAITATTPCVAGSYTFTTAAKQANTFNGPPGNNFVRVGNDPAVVISAGAASQLAFTGQPSTTETGDPITPSVKVKATDACNNPVSGVSVGIAIGTNPSGGMLSGTTPQTTGANGVAEFADLSINKSGTGYTLVASATGAPSVTSASFNIVDFLCTAFPCTLEDPDNHTSVTVNHPNKPLPGPLGLSLSTVGIPFGDENCGGTSVGRVVSILPDDSVSSNIVLEVTFRYGSQILPSLQGVNDPRLHFCANDGPGTDWYEVFNCSKPVTPKCISKRNATGTADLVITTLMTWTDPDWGGFI